MKKIIKKLAARHSADFIFLNILHIFNDGYRASLLLLLPFIALETQLDLTSVGILGSLLSSLGILLAIPSGYIAVRIGGMKTLILAMFLYGLGFLLTGAVFDKYLFIATFILAGFGFGIFHPIGFALVAKWSTKENRGRQMGTFSASGELGKIGIAAVVTLIIAYIGWRYTAGLYAFSALAFATYLLIYFSKRSLGDTVKEKHPNPIKFKEILAHKPFLLTLGATFFDVLASSALLLFLPFLLLQQGVEASFLGLFAAAFFVGNFLGKTFLGRVVDKFGSAVVFIGAEILMAIFIIALVNVESILLISIFSVLLGIFTLGTVPAIQTMISEAADHHGNYEKSFAVNALIASIGATITPLLLGIISDNYGVTIAFYLMAGFALLGIIPAVTLTLVKQSHNSS